MNDDRLAGQRIGDKVGNSTPIIGSGARTVDVKDPGNPHIDATHTVALEQQRLGAALAFVVGRARARTVH